PLRAGRCFLEEELDETGGSDSIRIQAVARHEMVWMRSGFATNFPKRKSSSRFALPEMFRSFATVQTAPGWIPEWNYTRSKCCCCRLKRSGLSRERTLRDCWVLREWRRDLTPLSRVSQWPSSA